MTRTAEDIVRAEVLCRMSSIVSTLAQGYGCTPGRTEGHASLGDLAEQALDLASPLDSYEDAANDNRFEIRHDLNGYYVCTEDEAAFEDDGHNSVGFDGRRHFRTTWQAARDVCEENDIEPYQREVFEHWAVTEWLGRKLEAKGEKVDFDFAGMVVWARTTTGQAIAIDGVVEEIAKELSDA